ncbi:MAG: hypothetical protein AAF989_07400 [Planctomycetota bacterium]
MTATFPIDCFDSARGATWAWLAGRAGVKMTPIDSAGSLRRQELRYDYEATGSSVEAGLSTDVFRIDEQLVGDFESASPTSLRQFRLGGSVSWRRHSDREESVASTNEEHSFGRAIEYRTLPSIAFSVPDSPHRLFAIVLPPTGDTTASVPR